MLFQDDPDGNIGPGEVIFKSGLQPADGCMGHGIDQSLLAISLLQQHHSKIYLFSWLDLQIAGHSLVRRHNLLHQGFNLDRTVGDHLQ